MVHSLRHDAQGQGRATCGNFTAPVSDWVCGGLCGSVSSAGQPTVRATDGLGLLGNVPVRWRTVPRPIPSPWYITPPGHHPKDSTGLWGSPSPASASKCIWPALEHTSKQRIWTSNTQAMHSCAVSDLMGSERSSDGHPVHGAL